MQVPTSESPIMRDNSWNAQISARLVAIRRQRGWSLDVTSKNTNVSKAMLGQIERGESSPTVTTLWKLASGFGLPFSAFLPVDDSPVRDRKKILSADSRMEVTPVFPIEEGVELEVFRIKLLGPRIQTSASHGPNSIEHVIVLEGVMKVYCGRRWNILESGDALRFDADRTHRYAAVSETATFHNIIYYR